MRRHFVRRAQHKQVGARGAILYVASHCQPFHSNGYAFRTQEILESSRDCGVKIHALTRLGYPWDRPDRSVDPAGRATVVDGIRYEHLPGLGRRWPLLIYTTLAAKRIARFARAHDVRLIHAASNHVNALAALRAARQLRVPFRYEIRGFWELSKAASHPDFERSRKFRSGLALEQFVATQADKVFAISNQVAHYLRENFRVPAGRIDLLPNCVASGFVNQTSSEPTKPKTIAYAGSLNNYEGIDLLLFALAKLRSNGTNLSLEIAGDGPAKRPLEALTEELRLAGSVNFLGSLPRHGATRLLGRSSLVCLPRQPLRVCELVPPLKLVEAMAMGRPVIVPDLPVFRDELGETPAGFLFRAGSSESLAATLDLAFANPTKLQEVGVLARQHVKRSRIWTQWLPEMWRLPSDPSLDTTNA